MLLADRGRARDFEDQSDCLASIVGEAFPTLNLSNRRVEQSGGDHVLLIIDDHFAFRFPRDGMHGLNLEIAVLRCLQRHSPVATPAYRYVDPAGRFAGYPFIQGSALTPARFAALPAHHQSDVLRTAASFLTELHSLDAGAISPVEQWPKIWIPNEYASRGLQEYLPAVAGRLPGQATTVEAFYRGYRELASPRRVVIHGDLVVEHVLLDDETGQISGIIDFGDVALGDPAQDFLGFWAYGTDAACQVADLYRPTQADPDLLARSRAHFIRYRLDRILESVIDDKLDIDLAAAEVDALLNV